MAGQVQELEATVTYPDGLEREMEITYFPHVGLDGKVAGYFALALDVSERQPWKTASGRARRWRRWASLRVA